MWVRSIFYLIYFAFCLRNLALVLFNLTFLLLDRLLNLIKLNLHLSFMALRDPNNQHSRLPPLKQCSCVWPSCQTTKLFFKDQVSHKLIHALATTLTSGGMQLKSKESFWFTQLDACIWCSGDAQHRWLEFIEDELVLDWGLCLFTWLDARPTKFTILTMGETSLRVRFFLLLILSEGSLDIIHQLGRPLYNSGD